ncbi:MAG: MFS transporter [Rhodobacteraceae bacterium]|nr:MFS transporter [Paracoccaceae bacterium]
MRRLEFIAFCGMVLATTAFSIDAMLPALPEIGQELSPHNLNNAQMVVIFFVLGLGLGTFFAGPLSDVFGRKPVILCGLLLYLAAALVAWRATSLELLLAARFAQGMGGAAPRIVTVAIIRDLFKGRDMARIISYAMMVFALTTAMAPALGAAIIALSSWRGVFFSFVLFALLCMLWTSWRLGESLPGAARRPLRLRPIWEALHEMMGIALVRISVVVFSLCFGMLMTILSTVQQVFEGIFDQGAVFPLWFGGLAILSASASFLNARLVARLGMRPIITLALGMQIGCTFVVFTAALVLPVGMGLFVIFLAWLLSLFFTFGLTLGNLNALVMEPLGHVAGLAASVFGAVGTILGGAIAIPVGLAFDGTLLPLTSGIGFMAILAFALMRGVRRGAQESA